MEKTPESPMVSGQPETDTGMLSGIWGVAGAGYVWDESVEPPAGDVFVGSNTTTRGPWLRALEQVPATPSRIYPMLKATRVLRDFVALAEDASPAAIQRFANQWGLLGRGRPVVRKAPGGSPVWFGESLLDWQREIYSFRILWETWEAVRTIKFKERSSSAQEILAARELLAKRIHWYPRGGGVGFNVETDQRTEVSHIAAPDLRPRLFESLREGDVVEPARYHVHAKLNERLRSHVDLQVLPSEDIREDSRIRFSPRDLLSGIYVHFALDLAGNRGQERNCLSCLKPFIASRKDQNYCDKNCRERAGYYRRQGREPVDGKTR